MNAAPTLYERCAHLAERVCTRGAPIRRLANNRLDQPMSDDQWRHHGQTAAFFAFIDAGGNADLPDSVNWHSQALFARALKLLQIYALGSQSDVYDRIIRERPRRAGGTVAELMWDAWHDASTTVESKQSDGAPRVKHTAAHQAQRYYDFWSRQDRPQIDDSFAMALTKLLRPQEAVWLIRRYRDGVPTAELARELCEKDARYQTPDGVSRAVRYIDVVVHRAKKRCREALADWQTVAQEVA